MAFVRICDSCRKRIKDGRFIEAGVGLFRSNEFHAECARPVVRFLKAVKARGIEELTNKSKNH